MSPALLDVNVLLALLDRDHVDHQRARDWLDAEIASGWAPCAITENGFVRIVSQPRYPNPISPTEAIRLLRRAPETSHHRFWPCEVSVLDDRIVDHERLHGPRQVTDAYLVALATRHGGRSATFDQSVGVGSVHGATEANLAFLSGLSRTARSPWSRPLQGAVGACGSPAGRGPIAIVTHLDLDRADVRQHRLELERVALRRSS